MSFTRVNKIRSIKPTCNFLSIVWTENNTNSLETVRNCQIILTIFEHFWKIFGKSLETDQKVLR